MRKVALLALVVLLGACGKTSAGDKTELFVSSASSLTEVMQSAEKQFQKINPEIDLVFNFGSSSKLSNQIIQGAPVDVFLSASTKDMDALLEKQHVHKNSIVNFAENRLVLASAEKINEARAEELLQATAEMVAVGEPESVPLGIYSKQALTSLGLWKPLEGRVIYAKDARQVLSYVESGNAEIGIVYASDAEFSSAIQTAIPLPYDEMEIVYPAAVLEASKNQDAAEAFLAFLRSDEGQKLFEEYGFLPAGEDAF